MKSIFALYDNYADADQAVNALLEEGFDEDQMNVLVREQIAKKNLDVGLHRVDVQKSDEVGRQTVRGLPALLGGEQPVPVPDIGGVLAAGDLATNTAQAASASWAPDTGLQKALMELSVPEDVAAAYRDGINEGGLLLWVRTADDQAPAAANALEMNNGKRVSDYSGNAPLH